MRLNRESGRPHPERDRLKTPRSGVNATARKMCKEIRNHVRPNKSPRTTIVGTSRASSSRCEVAGAGVRCPNNSMQMRRSGSRRLSRSGPIFPTDTIKR